MSAQKKLLIGAIIFPGFDCLDLYGPLRFFGSRPEFEIKIIAQARAPIPASNSASTYPDHTFDHCPRLDVVLLPGGQGTRKEVRNEVLLEFLSRKAEEAEYVLTVCTGSGLLAATGVLNGRRATSNKLAWEWVISNGNNVNWIKKARWIDDDKYITSAGASFLNITVSAGMDMALYFIKRLYGRDVAQEAARTAEYEWHEDSTWDPFSDMIKIERQGEDGKS